MNYKLKFFLNSSDICGENSLYDRINALNSVVCPNAGIFQTGLAVFPWTCPNQELFRLDMRDFPWTGPNTRLFQTGLTETSTDLSECITFSDWSNKKFDWLVL